MVVLVLPRLDCGSTVLFGTPLLVDKLQSVQNAAARLIFTARRRDHISPLPRGGYGLLAVLHFGWRYTPTAVFTAQHQSTCRVNFSESRNVHTRQRLRSSSSTALVISRTCRAAIDGKGFSVTRP